MVRVGEAPPLTPIYLFGWGRPFIYATDLVPHALRLLAPLARVADRRGSFFFADAPHCSEYNDGRHCIVGKDCSKCRCDCEKDIAENGGKVFDATVRCARPSWGPPTIKTRGCGDCGGCVPCARADIAAAAWLCAVPRKWRLDAGAKLGFLDWVILVCLHGHRD